ncbi:MAG: hypothetical protein EPO13_12290 [Actinomycetota bacterium]|nr:MAG: hypothetical protein EPO13_12290 [Actinomycetota bacterium]
MVGWAAAGIVAGATGIGVALLLAALAGRGDPVLAVGSSAIDLAPTPLKEFAVSRFGTADKTVLVGGMVAVLIGAAAVAGMLVRRHRLIGSALVALLGVLGAAATLTRPGSTATDAMPALIGAAVAAVALLALRSAAAPRPADLPERPPAATGAGETAAALARPQLVRPSRRRFLALGAGLGVVALATGGTGLRLSRSRAELEAARATIRLPAPADPAPPLPPGVDSGVPGATPFQTASDQFYRVDTALIVPRLDPRSYALEIGGMVDRPLRLSYDDLLAMPLVERDITLTCVSNEVGGPYVGSTRWLGVRLTDVLDRAGIQPAAEQLLSTSADGWTASTPVSIATDGRDALIAVGWNGEPLPLDHGFPVRLVVPGLYGYVSATKWLVSIKATTYADDPAYWTQRGWDVNGPILTQARIDVPAPLSRLAPGRVAIAGVAWAQHRGISAVEVQIDDDDWRPARLGAVPSADTWCTWVLPWEATPGPHTLRVRATDGSGVVQTAARTTPYPRGATGQQELVVIVG